MPGVTDRSGSPSTGATGTSTFARVDVPLSATNNLTFEGIVAPAHATNVGLSTLTELAATPDISNRDLFAGVVDHMVLSANTLLTLSNVVCRRLSCRMRNRSAGRFADSRPTSTMPMRRTDPGRCTVTCYFLRGTEGGSVLHGVGFHFAPFGSRLNCVLRYSGAVR